MHSIPSHKQSCTLSAGRDSLHAKAIIGFSVDRASVRTEPVGAVLLIQGHPLILSFLMRWDLRLHIQAMVMSRMFIQRRS